MPVTYSLCGRSLECLEYCKVFIELQGAWVFPWSTKMSCATLAVTSKFEICEQKSEQRVKGMREVVSFLLHL